MCWVRPGSAGGGGALERPLWALGGPTLGTIVSSSHLTPIKNWSQAREKKWGGLVGGVMQISGNFITY